MSINNKCKEAKDALTPGHTHHSKKGSYYDKNTSKKLADYFNSKKRLE